MQTLAPERGSRPSYTAIGRKVQMEFYADMHEIFSIYLMNYLFDMVCMCVNIRLKLMCVISNLNYACISQYMMGCWQNVASPITLHKQPNKLSFYTVQKTHHVTLSQIHLCWTLYNIEIQVKQNAHQTNNNSFYEM